MYKFIIMLFIMTFIIISIVISMNSGSSLICLLLMRRALLMFFNLCRTLMRFTFRVMCFSIVYCYCYFFTAYFPHCFRLVYLFQDFLVASRSERVFLWWKWISTTLAACSFWSVWIIFVSLG